jgi:hypothetical protein
MLCLARFQNFTINKRIYLGGIPLCEMGPTHDGWHGFSVFEEGMLLRHSAAEGEAIESNEFRSFSANCVAMVERASSMPKT